jgi:endonuclease/exonuclease/phosphatase family metal-dependent hydrolase
MRYLFLFMAACLSALNLWAQGQIKVASYNLRYYNQHDGVNCWENRRDKVNALIRFHEFDLIGTQEGLLNQLLDVLRLDEYAYTGNGRDDGKEAGEFSAIFYRKDRFELFGSGNFWLSETPEKPSLGWDSSNNKRICSWAKFKDKQTRKTFFFFNVHFDHKGVEARRQSGFLMVKKMKEIAGNHPVICTGDFNSTPETEQIQTIKQFLGDARDITEQPPYGPVGTFNGFKYDAPMDERIDYVFVSSHFTVKKYGVLTDAQNQLFPSDHLPVVVLLKFK